MRPGTCELRAKFPATLEAAEVFCAEFQLWRTANCGDLDAFGSELLLREAVTNSIAHGCLPNTHNSVSCIVRAKKGRVIILVHDEGIGFDWRAASVKEAQISDTGGRGIEIYRMYADRVRFSQKGNMVTLVKRF